MALGKAIVKLHLLSIGPLFLIEESGVVECVASRLTQESKKV